MLTRTRAAIATLAQTSTATAPPSPAIGGPATTFVFRAGAVTSNGVYAAWSDLMQAVNQTPGQKLITCDDSIAPCTVPAGAWTVDNCVISSIPKPNSSGTLNISDGAVFVFNRLDLVDVRLFVHATAPVATFSNGDTAALRLDSSTIDTLSAPFIRVTSTGGVPGVLLQNLSSIGTGAHSVFQVDAGASLDINAVSGSTINGNATSGAGTVDVSLDASVFVAAGPQAATFTLFPLGTAQNVPYTPTSLVFWNNNNPRTLQAALDRLAAHVGPVP